MDDELRALEQALAAGGDATTRLRLAHALGRAGREAARLETLLAGRDDLAVRRELGAWPAWSERAGPGRTRFVDVAPLLSAPRLRWQLGGIQPEREGDDEPAAWALASPLAIALVLSPPGVVVLDPETGARRWRLENEEVAGLAGLDLALAGDVLILRLSVRGADRLEARDLWNGERLWERSGAERGKVLGLRLAEPREFPQQGWTREITSAHGKGLAVARPWLLLWEGGAQADQVDLDVVACSELIAHYPGVEVEPRVPLSALAARLLVLDPASGAERWGTSGRPLLVDRAGVIRWFQGCHVHDPVGREVWTGRSQGLGAILGVTPDLVLGNSVGPIGNRRLLALDRATGALRWGHAWPRPGASAIARGAAYTLHDEELVSLDLHDGRIAWRLDASALSGRDGVIEQLIPLPGRLLVVASDGGLTCLEPGGA